MLFQCHKWDGEHFFFCLHLICKRLLVLGGLVLLNDKSALHIAWLGRVCERESPTERHCMNLLHCDGICGLIDSNTLSTFCRLLFATMLDGNVHIVVNPVAGEASFSLSWGTIFDAFQYMFDVTCVCVWNWCKCTFCSMLLSGNLPSTKKKCLLLKLRRLRCAVWSSSDDCVTVSQAVRVFD